MDMDVFYVYVYSTAGWLGLQASTLILMPKLVINLLSEEAHYSTKLEVYFSRSLGYSLMVLTLVVLFFTGVIPLTSSISQPISMADTDTKAPYAVPIVTVTALYHGVAMTYCYVRWVNNGLSGFVLGAIAYGILALIGGWCILFGTSAGKFSKRTGRDKRMAGFPFQNVNEYDKRTDKKVKA